MLTRFVVSELSQLEGVAKAILTKHPNKRIFLFNGQMGAGKTTFISAFCKTLEVQEDSSSPTFSIVNEYISVNGPIFHFDFYRLKDAQEAFDMGAEEYFFSGNYCLIEWPDIVKNLLPSNAECVEVNIVVNQENRIITFN